MRLRPDASRYLLIVLAIVLGFLTFGALRGFWLYSEVIELKAHHERTHARIREVHEKFREEGVQCGSCHRAAPLPAEELAP